MIKVDKAKFFLLTLSLLVALSLFAFSKEILNTIRVKNEIARLEKQARELEEKNSQLKSLTEYLASDAYKDKAARENLNLQLPGEVALALPDVLNSSDTGQQGETNAQNTPTQKMSNTRAWFNYFFASTIE